MEYQISYLSEQGHVKELARCFKTLFPSRTPVVDLSKHYVCNKATHLVGFEYMDAQCKEIPHVIQEYLKDMSNKEILLFVTCPVCVTTGLIEEIEKDVLGVLPNNCKYHGIFACQGEVCISEIDKLCKIASGKAYKSEERILLSEYRKSRGHPNREDIRRGYRYISSELNLDTYLI